jgi:hypothetical protein
MRWHRRRLLQGPAKYQSTNHTPSPTQVDRNDLSFNHPSFKRPFKKILLCPASVPHIPVTAPSSSIALQCSIITSSNSSPKPSALISRVSPLITMASSLRVAAPKMASMAAQSSVKVARSPMMRSQQLQKFARSYSGKQSNMVSITEGSC